MVALVASLAVFAMWAAILIPMELRPGWPQGGQALLLGLALLIACPASGFGVGALARGGKNREQAVALWLVFLAIFIGHLAWDEIFGEAGYKAFSLYRGYMVLFFLGCVLGGMTPTERRLPLVSTPDT